MKRYITGAWIRFWMLLSGQGQFGRLASALAAWAMPPHFGKVRLANLYAKGFVAASARISHPGLRRGRHVFIDDRVLVIENGGGSVALGDRVRICRDSTLETGAGAQITIGESSYIQPRCQMSAHKGSIRIGRRVQLAAGCALYSYDHGIAAGQPIWDQPLTTQGDIEICDDSWLGHGAIVLSGVRIGTGAVIGAGAVVTRDVPDGCIAVGNPARVVGSRDGSRIATMAPQSARLRG